VADLRVRVSGFGFGGSGPPWPADLEGGGEGAGGPAMRRGNALMQGCGSALEAGRVGHARPPVAEERGEKATGDGGWYFGEARGLFCKTVELGLILVVDVHDPTGRTCTRRGHVHCARY
jgi:hypothetical protein